MDRCFSFSAIDLVPIPPRVPFLTTAIAAFLLSPILAVQGQGAADANGAAIALLNDRGSDSEAAYLAAELTGIAPGLRLLERQDLGEIVSESRLILSSLPDSLESADFLVLIESIRFDPVEYLAARIVGRSSGQILWSDLHPKTDFSEDWAPRIAAAMSEAQARSDPASDEGRITLSVRTIVEELELGATENESIGAALTRLVAAALSGSEAIRVLERSDLPLVHFERVLTRIDEGTFNQADFILTGSYRPVGDQGTEFVIRLDRPGEPVPITHRGTTDTRDPVEIASAMAMAVAAQIEIAGEPVALAATQGTAALRATESRLFSEAAVRSVRLGHYSGASKHAAAAALISGGANLDADFLHILSELCAAIPSLNGRGMDPFARTGLHTRDPHGELARLDFWESYRAASRDRGDTSPFPVGPELVEATALAAEKYRDLYLKYLQRVEAAPGNAGTRNSARDRLRLVGQPLARLIGALVWSIYEDSESSPRAELANPLARLGRVLDDLAEIEGFSEDRLPPSLRSDLGSLAVTLALQPSSAHAVESLAKRLYGKHTQALAESDGEEFRHLWLGASGQRQAIFSYFEALGFGPGDTGIATYMPENLMQSPFVAWLSGSGSNLDAVFESATTLGGPVNSDDSAILREIDRRFRDYCKEPPGADRDRRYLELREAIVNHADTLVAAGILELYADYLSELEFRRVQSGGLQNPDDQTFAFWARIHQTAVGSPRGSARRLTGALTRQLQYAPWRETEPQKGVALIRSMQADVAELAKRIEFPNQLNVMNQGIDSLLAMYAAGDTPTEPQGAGPADPLDSYVLRSMIHGLRCLTVGSLVNDTEYLLVQKGYDDDWSEAVVNIFSLESWTWTDHIQLPSEAKEWLRASGRNFFHRGKGERIRIEENVIRIALPGGTASYDRGSQSWETAAIPFLADKDDVCWVGDRIVATLGTEVNGPVPPVQGIYAMSHTGDDTYTLVDNSRTPPVWAGDSLRRMSFASPPISLPGRHFMIAMDLSQSGHRHRLFFMPTVDTNPGGQWMTMGVPFDLAPNAKLSHGKSNGFVSVCASLMLYEQGSWEKKTGRLHVAAFATKEVTKPLPLLDSAVTEGPAPEGEDGRIPSPARMVREPETPLFHFPREYTYYEGNYPESTALLFDGTSLTLLTEQTTPEGGRMLYHWKNQDQSTPTRLVLHVDTTGLFERSSEEQRIESDQGTLRNIKAIHSIREHLFFETSIGLFPVKRDALFP